MLWYSHQVESENTEAPWGIKNILIYILYALTLMSVNILVLFPIGMFAARISVFPHSCCISRRLILGFNSIQYMDDFLALVQKVLILMNSKKMQQSVVLKSPYVTKKNDEFYKNISEYSNPEINQKFRSMIDLTELYSKTNSELMLKNRKVVTSKMRQLNILLIQFSGILDQLDVKIKDHQGFITEMKLAEYYDEENEKNYDDTIIPILLPDQHTLLHQFEKLTIQLENLTARINKPINLCCCRVNCCGLFYHSVFHSNDQLEHMLEENFDGRRFTVKSRDGKQLDCMFFPFSNEKVLTMKEIEQMKQVNDTEAN